MNPVVHCFSPGTDLWTLCGNPYEFETVAMWPSSFLGLMNGTFTFDAGDSVLCPDCVGSQDLELALLAEAA